MKIYLSHNKSFVFDYHDAVKLRDTYRIVGNLIGCFARKPRQNTQLGLPLQLLPEEVTLLLEKQIAEILHEPSIFPPTSDEISCYKNHFNQVFQEQNELSIQERYADVSSKREKILAGIKAKRAKQRKKKESSGDKTCEVDDEDLEKSGDSLNDDKEIEKIVEKIKPSPMPQTNTLIQIPTADWRHKSYEKADWKYPQTDIEGLRYRVFKEFWEKGYFLTSGGKFGGDYLVYPGEPARYHSYFIAVCILPSEELSMLQISSMGRLGTTVKKTVVLCSTDINDKLTFTSLNWSHIS